MTQNMTGPTPDDIETFGQDLVEFSQRAATPIVDQRVGHLEQRSARSAPVSSGSSCRLTGIT
jgi:hypothetical protein